MSLIAGLYCTLSGNQVSLMLGSLDAVTKTLLFNKEAYLDVENHSKSASSTLCN